MDIEEVRAYTLLHAPSLLQQRLAYSNVVENVVIARSRFDPTFRARREWKDQEDPGRSALSVSQTLPADFEAELASAYEEAGDLATHSLRLSKVLLGGGSLAESRLPVDRALFGEARQANGLRLEQRRLLLSVSRQYYGILRDQLTVGMREVQIERAKQNLEHALIKEDPLDIATARLRIPESELSELTARRAAESGLLSLRADIGMRAGEPLQVETNFLFEVKAVDLEADRLRAVEENEAVLNARLDLELARLEARVARTRHFPTVSASLRAEQEDGPSGETDPEFRGELVLEWPWLDRADRAESRKALADVRSAEIALEEARRSAERDFENAVLRLEEAEISLKLQEERIRVLEQQMRLYQDRWENGEISILEYLRSQDNLENARVQRITQQTRYLELHLEYEFHAGR